MIRLISKSYGYVKRVKANIAYHNGYAESKELPYWAKLLRAMLEINPRYHTERWAVTNKINYWFFKIYLFGKIGE